MTKAFSLTFSIVFLLVHYHAGAIELTEAVQITNIFEDIQFARNTQGAIDVDSQGQVHLVYFIPGTGAVPVNELYHQTITGEIISEPIRIDQDSLNAIHPVMVVDQQDNVHVVWHDRRDSTAAGNYFDNVEIYYDEQLNDESFSSADMRITHSSANHLGDNSYLPQIMQTEDSRLHIIWYDFVANGSVADAYLLSSNENGEFETITDLSQYRITNASEQNQNSVWMPTFAETTPNHIYVVYGQQETFTDPFELKGFEIAPDGNQSTVETISPTGSSFFDPPRLASDEQGNLGLVYQNRVDGINQILFQYKPANEAWSEPVTLSSEDINAAQPDIDFDLRGNANIVWREETGLGWFAKINPQTQEIIEQEAFSDPIDFVMQPVIAINSNNDQRHIAWVSERIPDETIILLASEQVVSVEDWHLY